MHDLFLLHLIFHKKEVQKANQCFLSVWFLVFQCTYYKMEVLWYTLRYLDEIQFSSELSLSYITKMFNLDSITNENNKEDNQKWPYISDHPYTVLITGGSGSRKTNTLLNLIKEQDDTDKVYLYAKYLSEPKYEFFIKKSEGAGVKHDSKAFIECSNTMNDVYENTDEYNPNRKRKILIVFDDMIADIMTNKKFQAIVKELFIRCRKLNISLAFITQSYFSVPKDVRLNSTHFWLWKLTTEENYKILQ